MPLTLTKPQENDVNWGDIVNENYDKIIAIVNAIETQLINKVDIGHTHDHKTDEIESELDIIKNKITEINANLTNLFSDKADKIYVINLLQNFDHPVTGLTPIININGQGSSSQSLRINCWINSPAFLLEYHLSYKYDGISGFTVLNPQNNREFIINKPNVNAPYWQGNTITGITIKVKCRNPFLQDNWSDETILTDADIEMFNFLDADKIVTALVASSSFQTTISSVIGTNPVFIDLVKNKIVQSSNT